MVQRRSKKRKRVTDSYAEKMQAASYNYNSSMLLTQIKRFPLPLKLKRELRYMESSIGLNPGVAGTAADYVFSANGLYDPNITGVGHQPLGFDNYMAMYEHYTVIGAKITVQFQNTETIYMAWAGIAARSGSGAIANGPQAVENGMCVVTPLNKADVSGDFRSLSYPLSIGKFMGRHNILAEDDFRGTSTANPNEEVYFHVIAFPNNAQDIGQITAHVVIDYIAIFTEPKNINQS